MTDPFDDYTHFDSFAFGDREDAYIDAYYEDRYDLGAFDPPDSYYDFPDYGPQEGDEVSVTVTHKGDRKIYVWEEGQVSLPAKYSNVQGVLEHVREMREDFGYIPIVFYKMF